jgi:hypothetical protein
MLELAIIALLIGTIYAVYLAPPEQKALVGGVVVVLAAAGYGVGMAITKAGTDERTYYPIAAAIGGAMVAFAWISKRQKTWPKRAKDAPKP